VSVPILMAVFALCRFPHLESKNRGDRTAAHPIPGSDQPTAGIGSRAGTSRGCRLALDS
jgi:hypothetical protein